MTQSELLEAALAALGGDEFELARRCNYTLSTAHRQFSRWRGDTGMNFEHTITLLRIAGWLCDNNA